MNLLSIPIIFARNALEWPGIKTIFANRLDLIMATDQSIQPLLKILAYPDSNATTLDGTA